MVLVAQSLENTTRAMKIPDKVLVVILDNIGDAILGSTVIPVLREKKPDLQVGFWVKKYAAQIFNQPDEKIKIHAADPFWDKSPGTGKGRWRSFKKCLDEIKAQNYEMAIILNTEWRRSMACWWAQIPMRIGYRQRKSRFFLTHSLGRNALKQHVVDDHFQLISKMLGPEFRSEALAPLVFVTSEEKKLGEQWRDECGWQNKKIVSIHPVSGDIRKDWPIHNWLKTIRSFSEDHSVRFNVLAPPHRENEFMDRFEVKSSPQVKVSGGSLSVLKSMLSVTNVFAGGDSGPGHVAGALHVPLVSIFGPTEPARYEAWGNSPRKIMKRENVADIGVAEIVQSIKELL